MITQDLGIATAYGYAKSKGYTGTEAEFAELMASYAEVGQTAVTAAQTATTKASEAATSATTATNKASEATTAATTATNKAAEAQADADAAALDASQALSAASTATTKATEATTAAATATSAKTDAVAANTAAQSAKTAAQTAQAGAETAAASVSASAEQIATNAEDISQLKSDLNTTLFADGCPYIKELYINEAGRSAGVDKLHSVYISNSGSSTAYFIRFCNSAESAYTGHTLNSATPTYGVTPIYSGMSGQNAIYGYVIFDWDKITANLTPKVALNEKSYRIDFSPQIASTLGIKPIIEDITNKMEYPYYDLVLNTFDLIATDYDLNDVADSANRFATTDAFFCKGKVRIDFDSSIVGIGLKLYIMSMQSGRNRQYAVSMTLNESSYTFELNDTVRVAVFNANGIAPQYNTVVSTTKIYTLSDGVYFNYLNNSIIGAKKIWCFGDSLTAGVITGSTTITESYTYWLKKFLGNDNADITNYGVPGDTAVNMLSVISNKTFYGNCDIAIIMIGTNGFMNGDATDPTTPIGAYYASIEHIINSGKGTVKIVLMNPPKSIRDGVPTRWLDSMHYKEEIIAEHFNLDMVDLYTLLPFDPNNTTYYSSDKTHFTAIGYYYIAYIVHQYLVSHMTAQQVGGNPTFDY